MEEITMFCQVLWGRIQADVIFPLEGATVNLMMVTIGRDML